MQFRFVFNIYKKNNCKIHIGFFGARITWPHSLHFDRQIEINELISCRISNQVITYL